MTKNKDLIDQNKIFIWIGAVICSILSIPLILTQTNTDWDWKLPDFIIMSALMFGSSSIFVIAARKKPKHRVLIGAVIAIAFLLTWIHFAVGIVDTWLLAGN